MTPLQYESLKFIDQYTESHGKPPTLREIGEHVGSHLSHICVMMKSLEKRGFVLKEGGWRSLRVLKMPASWAA